LEIQAEIPETRIRRSRKVVSICTCFFRNHHTKGLVEKWLKPSKGWLKTITQKGWLKTITQKGWLVVFCLTAESDLVVQIVPPAAHDKVHGVVSYFCSALKEKMLKMAHNKYEKGLCKNLPAVQTNEIQPATSFLKSAACRNWRSEQARSILAR